MTTQRQLTDSWLFTLLKSLRDAKLFGIGMNKYHLIFSASGYCQTYVAIGTQLTFSYSYF